VVLSGLKLHQHTNVRSRSVVQLVLHLCFGLNRLPAAYGAFHALIVACAGKADGDVFTSEFRSADSIALPVDFGVLEHVGVLEGKRVIVVSVLDFDDVATVGSPGSFSSISSLAISTRILIVMCVGPSPLRVNQLSSLYLQVRRVKIVLYRRICLHDVPAFSTHIQVVNGPRFKSCGSCLEHEKMRTVLEGATKLSSVNRKTEGLVAGANVDLGVVLDGGNDALSTICVSA